MPNNESRNDIARRNIRDLWAALDLVREAVETQEVGLLPAAEALEPCPFVLAEHLVRAIHRIGGGD